jgi:hypothetical protein
MSWPFSDELLDMSGTKKMQIDLFRGARDCFRNTLIC